MAGGGWGKLLLERTPTPILLEIQKHVRERLERKWLPIFICTEGFQSRQSPNMKLSDLMDDLLFNRRKRSQAIYKVSLSINLSKIQSQLDSYLKGQFIDNFIKMKTQTVKYLVI